MIKHSKQLGSSYQSKDLKLAVIPERRLCIAYSNIVRVSSIYLSDFSFYDSDNLFPQLRNLYSNFNLSLPILNLLVFGQFSNNISYLFAILEKEWM